MHREFVLLSPGKASSHGAVLYTPSFSSCFRVSIPPAVRPTYLFTQMDAGSLTCAHIRVSAVHTKGGVSQAQTSLHTS